MRDPVSKLPYKKTMSLFHNLPPAQMAPLFKWCQHGNTKHHLQHETVEGTCPGHGSRTKLSQVYPTRFCTTSAMNILNVLYPGVGQTASRRQVHFVADLLECVGEKADLQLIHAWTVARTSGSLFEAQTGLYQPVGTSFKLHEQQLLGVASTMDTLPLGTEVLIHLDKHPQVNNWWFAAKQLRQWILPRLGK
jgi:hypothetical protein